MVTTSHKPTWCYPGSPQFLLPGTDQHSRVISPSKVAAICGVSRWHSAYSLWTQMKGWCPPEVGKDIFDTGKAFELALAELWRIKNPNWRLSPSEVQFATDQFGFPAVATIDRRATHGWGRGQRAKVVEFKIAHHTDEWGDESLAGDCPADYALQVIAQQVFTGLHADADLLVMGPFFKHRTYTVAYDPVVAYWMLASCRSFWDSLNQDTPPPLDNSVATYYAVKAQHPDINAGEQVEVPEGLVDDLHRTRKALRGAEDEHRGHTTKMLDAMGNAQFAVVDGQRVADRRPHSRGGVSLVLR